MHLDHIELSQLVISRVNMRAKHKKDFADLVPSVRARGVLVPLLVRPNGELDKYEIVAGRRRYLAASAVASEGGPATAPCAIMEAGDDAAALEASLIENVARLDADEVTQWETFARLIKEGRTEEEIAATFGMDENIVRRVLALGNLLPRVRNLYRQQQIDPATVRHLTMATTAQQRDWLALFESTDSYAPTGRMLKEWLFGGSAIQTLVALFDLAEYPAPIIADLFDKQSYFADSAAFWKLQNSAIEAKRDAYRADGWSDVVILNDGTMFDRWNHDKRTRTKGGRVYIHVALNGTVEVHEGLLPRKEAQRADRAEQTDGAKPRQELSAPLRRYVDLHRHAIVRTRLLNRPWFALRVMLAHAITGSSLWNLRCEWQRADKAETEQSIAGSKAQQAFVERRATALAQLNLDPGQTLVNSASDPSIATILEILEGLSDDDVLALIPIVMGETLDAASEAVSIIGGALAVEPSEFWEPDDAFFALLRDRKVLHELLSEVAGSTVAQANADASGKLVKAILRDCLIGQHGREKVEGWVPRWMRFPAGSYLSQESSDATEADEAVTDEAENPTGSDRE